MTDAAAPAGAGLLLTLNAGSSSLKFALFDAGAPDGTPPRIAGLAEGLGTDAATPARIRVRDAAGMPCEDTPLPGRRHADALAAMERVLAARAGGVRLVAVGHRIVHGGAHRGDPAPIDAALLAELEALVPLAPLHQPHNIAGVRAALARYPDTPQVACFDTAFHRTQPEVHRRFAIPARWHDAGIRRYGFHGLSYESICHRLGGAPGRTAVAHLGNGASMCAIRDGRSVATTMSFSPLDGLVMGTRCGRIDAAVVLHLIRHHGLTPEAVTQLLFHESGLLGVSGRSSDMRTLAAAIDDDASRAAIDLFVERALQELAAMAAALDGLDRVVFTGGIGENAAALRARVVERAGWMGLTLDAEANRAGAACISRAEAAVQVLVVPTDEEAMIARHAARVAATGAARC